MLNQLELILQGLLKLLLLGQGGDAGRDRGPGLPWILVAGGAVAVAVSMAWLGAAATPPSVVSLIIAAALGVDSGALLNREDNRFGLDEKGIEVLDYLQASPQIAPALATVAEALKPYSPSPSTATLAMPGKAKRTKQPAN